MRIIVDMDQVLAEWVEHVISAFNKVNGTVLSREDVRNYWDMNHLFGEKGKEFMEAHMDNAEVYKTLKPVEDSLWGMVQLRILGHDVLIGTAVPFHGGAFQGKIDWIRKHMPWFDLKNLIAVQRKEILDADLLIDDGPHNIEKWKETGRPSIVFGCPWNKSIPQDGLVHRAENWQEVINIVDHLSKEIIR